MPDIDKLRYYEILLTGLNLPPLTYHTTEVLEPFCEVQVALRGKKVLGYILREIEKPSFKTNKIISILPKKLTKIQIELLRFISYYYVANPSITSDIFISLQYIILSY